ncbi:hypothetical protein LCGC14_2968470, partial [marine sediment metagenome]
PGEGDVLSLSGNTWVASGITASLSGLTDTSVAGVVSGQNLAYDGTNWILMEKKKRSIVLYAKDMISAVTNGTTILKLEATTNLNGRDTHVFINANDTFALFDWIPPPEYDSGTVSYRYFWTTPGLDTDGVAMALEGVATGDGDPLDVDHGTPVILVPRRLVARMG